MKYLAYDYAYVFTQNLGVLFVRHIFMVEIW